MVLPLIGTAVGLSPADVGLLIGAGGLADFLLFPVSGFLMDRFGRLAAIVPAFSLMGAGLFLLVGLGFLRLGFLLPRLTGADAASEPGPAR